jgi:acyl carrier protein
VGIQDNFFDLGGHSLMVTRVLSRIREELGIDLAVSTVFQGPTVAELDKACVESQIGEIDDEEMLQMLEELENS